MSGLSKDRYGFVVHGFIFDIFYFLLGVTATFKVLRNIKTKKQKKTNNQKSKFMSTRRFSTLVAGVFLAGCMMVHAQTVSLGSNKVTLKQVFEKIEKASKYRIVYNAMLIDTSRTHLS